MADEQNPVVDPKVPAKAKAKKVVVKPADKPEQGQSVTLNSGIVYTSY